MYVAKFQYKIDKSSEVNLTSRFIKPNNNKNEDNFIAKSADKLS